MLGTSDPFFWFLVPLFAIISVGICIVMNYVVLMLTHVLALITAYARPWAQRLPDGYVKHHISRSPISNILPSTTSYGGAMNQRLFTTGMLLLLPLVFNPMDMDIRIVSITYNF